ncbi:uncharacterized protein V1510DRAFT_401233 [Dipodascopsis tothii]|uniref:uncharacterized protein n=1 Tax=Dipodascopsis tothii TaxID=44089 RepID=UPI0034CD74FF
MVLGHHAPQTLEEVQVDDVDEVDGEHKNMLLSIISSLRPGSDLSRITLPTFILERKSMLERITNQLSHPDLLLSAHNEAAAVDRFVGVVRWYLSGWHITPKAVKKPLNPVLSEYFTCYWDLPNNTKAYYIAEQTSHHPPKSSYFYMSPENGIRVDGTLVPRSRFLGNSVASMMEGIGYLTFMDKQDLKGNAEVYELTQPNMYARNILIGKLKYELGDHSIIQCPGNDLIADVEFKVKGFISGTYNAIAGKIKRISTGEVLYELSGKWNEVMDIKNMATGKKTVLFDANHAKPQFPKVRPIEEQGLYESRRLWLNVTNALARKDHEVATDEKFKIEDRQRQDTKKREEDGVEWHPRLFKHVPGQLEWRLAKEINGTTPQEQTDQILSVLPILDGQPRRHDLDIPPLQRTPPTQ